jgi:hypothetical protein
MALLDTEIRVETDLQDGTKDGNLPERLFHSVSTLSRFHTSPSKSSFLHCLLNRIVKGGKLMTEWQSVSPFKEVRSS